MKTNTKKYLIIGILISMVIILIASVFIYKRTKENNVWELATKTNSSTSYEDYLKSYPNGKYKIKADSLYDQSLWTETIKASYFEAYQSYLNKIPNGFHIVEAKTILDKSKELPILNGKLIEKKELIIFPNHQRFLVVGLIKKIDKFNTKIQTAIYKCDINKINSGDNIWHLIWKTNEVQAFEYDSLYVLKTTKSALIFSGYNSGGCYGLSNYFVFRLDLNGKVKTETNVECTKGESALKKNNTIIATEFLKRIEYNVINDEIFEKVILKSDMAPPGAVKAYFHLNENGEITSSIKNLFDLKIGQIIAFIPDDEITKTAFNVGDIEIHMDDSNEYSGPCSANAILQNFCTFDGVGEFHFYLDYSKRLNINYSTDFSQVYQPIFTISVSKPIIQSINRVQSVQNTQSTSNSQTATNTQSSTSGSYHRSNRDYFTGESAVHEFLSRHSFVSNEGSRLSYSIGDLTITYNRGRLRFTNIEVRIYNQNVAVVSATDIGSGRTLRIQLNATYGSIVDLNDNSMSFQAVN